MRKDKRTRPSAGTLERAAENRAFDRASISVKNCTTAVGQIASLLGRGQAAAITRRDLEALTGLDPRAVRTMISRERRQGAQILSDNRGGFYMSRSEDEALRWCDWMDRRAAEILATADGVREGAVT